MSFLILSSVTYICIIPTLIVCPIIKVQDYFKNLAKEQGQLKAKAKAKRVE